MAWLLHARDCVPCPSTPACTCSPAQDCILTARTCAACATIQCVPKPALPHPSPAVGAGVIAGPVAAVLLLAGASIALWWWFRKRKLRDLAKVAEIEKRRTATGLGYRSPSSQSLGGSDRFPRDVRGSFDDDPPPPPPPPFVSRARTRPLTGISEGFEEHTFPPYASAAAAAAAETHDLAPLQRHALMMNPFDDRQSIATHDEGDGQSFVSSSTNVIPIAFVPSHPTQASTPTPPPSDAQTALQVARERALVTGRLKVGTTPTPPSGLGSGGQGLGAGLTPTSAIAPSRPARSPDLDLRLVAPAPPPTTGNTMETLLPPDPRSRVSVTTTRSAAPSFLSGHSSASGMMVDPPVIVTSRHVQLGVRQAAEVVNFAAAAVEPFPLSAGRESFRRSRPQSAATALETYAPHGHHQQEDPFSDPPADALPSSSSSLSSSARSSATVTAPGGGGGGGGGADAAYRLQPQRSTATFGEPSPHHQEAGYVATTDAGGGGAATGDLRFSIGSLAASTRYDDGARDSVSTQGTSFVQPVGAIGEARRVLVGVAAGGGGGGAMGGAPTAWQTRGSFSAFAAAAASTDQEADEAPAEEDYSIPLARPRPGFANASPHQQQQYGGQGGGGGGGGRESIMSSRSDDSFLNAIIPPKFTSPYAVTGGELSSPGRKMVGQLQYLPTSMSTDTFASPAAAGKSRTTTMGGSMTSPSPSPSKPPPSFPLSRAPTTTTMGNAQASESRYTLGLSGFEFQIGDDDDDHVHDDESAREELPPMPLPSRTWSS